MTALRYAATIAITTMAAALVAAGPARADLVYLSLGDSIAFGYDPSTPSSVAPSYGDQGYVSLFADELAGRNGGVRPTVLNLGIPGEQSTSFLDTSNFVTSGPTRAWPLNLNYGDGTTSQRSLMLSSIADLHAAGHEVGVVTLIFGGNDLFALTNSADFQLATPAEQVAMVGQTITTALTNYATVLTDLLSVAPRAEVFLPGYYNPFPSAIAPAEHAFYDLVLGFFNPGLQGVAAQFGATYVDLYSAFDGRELALTNIATGDVHPNQAGYALIAASLGAASVPEPASIVSMALGLGGLGAAWLSRRRCAARRSA